MHAPQRPAVPRASVDLLTSAVRDLEVAATWSEPAQRYAAAQLVARRTAAAVLAARARPDADSPPRRVWPLVHKLAPELREWAQFFAAVAAPRPTGSVSAREADDLVREAAAFLNVVARLLLEPNRRAG